MVVALGPGKFYGGSLPRPRFYSDVKFSSDRVDPPASVSDPLLSWAHEAHWSMGGLSFKRLRLQGRIEGNITRLRAQHRRSDKHKAAAASAKIQSDKIRKLDEIEFNGDDSQSETEIEVEPEPEPQPEPAKKRARKLVDEFDRVADADRVAYRTRSKRSESNKVQAVVVPRRTSPRKAVAEKEVVGRRTSPRKLRKCGV